MVEEIGGLALFIALEVGLDLGDEGLEGFGKVCHAGDDRDGWDAVKEKGGCGKAAGPQKRAKMSHFPAGKGHGGGVVGSWRGLHDPREGPP